MMTPLFPLLFCLMAHQALAQVGPGVQCLCFQEIGFGEIQNPLAVVNIPDGTGRIYVVEQRGVIWIYNTDGTRLPTPYLNITESIIYPAYNVGFYNFRPHPQYATNGRIYLHYTVRYENLETYQRISEMTVSSDPDVIDPATERVLLDVYFYTGTSSPGGEHSGGGLLFDIDGYLQIHMGDGWCCYDPLQSAQNKTNLLGSIIRIDVDSRTGNLPYGIPADNPFLDEPETLPEIYAYGIRNPYTAGFDTGDRNTGEGRGRMFFGDVGQNTWEEVDEVVAGGNYGWPAWEADICHDPDECPTMGPVESPALSYNRTYGSCVMYGGIYRGCMNPALNGWMLFGDYSSSFKFGATEQPDNTWSWQLIPGCQSCPGDLTNVTAHFILGWGVDEAGEQYIAAQAPPDPFSPGGSVYKIVDPNNPGTPCPI